LGTGCLHDGERTTPLHTGTLNTQPMGVAERRLSRLLLVAEDLIKVPLFGCQRCGECILSSTAFICSQNCPKRMRNGPCGGTGQDGSCEVFRDRKCVWYRIYHRSRRLHRLDLLWKRARAHSWNLEGTSSWLNVMRKRIEPPVVAGRRERH